MNKDVIEYEIDNINSNILIKKDFLEEYDFFFRYVYEYSLNDLFTLINKNFLFKNPTLYICKLYFNSKKDLTVNYESYDEIVFYID